MTVEPIGLIACALGLIALFSRYSFIVYVFLGATLLGAAAAIILNNLGGTTVQPAHLLLGFLIAKLLRSRDFRVGMLQAVSVGSPGFWLLITTVYAVIAAYLMPRLFLGQTMVFSARAIYAAPLVPTTSNLTQSIYLIGDCVCFLALSGFGGSDAGRKCLGRAALTCVVLNLVFAAFDLVTYATNTANLMSFFRNSTYSILSDQEVAGFKRIVGSFVEASSFGYCTLGYFAFSTSLWLSGIAPLLTFSLSVLSFIALLFSTSTTAYVGVAVYLLSRYIVVAFTFLRGPIRIQMFVFLIGLPLMLTLTAIIVCLSDASYAYVSDLLNTFILNKMSSDSGIERSSWNSQAIQNFLDTYGFGVGDGSLRASSFVIALLANLGFLGSATYGLFLLMMWFKRRPAPPAAAAMQAAARSACLAWLIGATVSGGYIDLGLPFFACAALGCAESLSSRGRLQGNMDKHRRNIFGNRARYVASLVLCTRSPADAAIPVKRATSGRTEVHGTWALGPSRVASTRGVACSREERPNREYRLGMSVANCQARFLDAAIKANYFDYICVHPYEIFGGLADGGEPEFLSITATLRKVLALRSFASI